MFGLENQKKKKPSEGFVFEIEKEMKDPVKQKEIYQCIEKRLQRIKEILRLGNQSQEEFDRVGSLLHGYNSLIKVLSRVNTKKK